MVRPPTLSSLLISVVLLLAACEEGTTVAVVTPAPEFTATHALGHSRAYGERSPDRYV
jgi:hypothetical protein